jgi:hypothetical protein
MKLVNNKKVLVEDVEGTSQYDGQQVLKDVHSLPGHYLRTKDAFSLVTAHFDSFQVTYDSNNNPTFISYLVGITPHLTTIGLSGDVNGSLQDTGFIISSSKKEKRFAIYYTVSGQGSAPSMDGVTNIEVPLELDDSGQIVALATKLALEKTCEFDIKTFNSVLEIKTKELGITNNTILLPNSSFLIQNTSGEVEKVEEVNISYSDSGYPIWQGQELKEHKYNIYTAKFETLVADYTDVYGKKSLNVVNSDEVVWDEIVTSFPDTTSELYTYRFEQNTVQTVLVTYANGSRSSILSVVKTRV